MKERDGLYLRGKTWWISYYADGERQFESTGTKNKRDAETFRSMRISEVQRRVFVKDTKVALDQLGERYMEHAKLHKRSWKRDEQLLGDLKRLLGNPMLKDITPTRIEKFQQARAAEVAPATVNRATALLKRMFFQAEKWGMHSGNPVRLVSFLREDSFNPVTLSEEQEANLIAAAPPYIQDLVTFDLNTGLRKSDLFDLKWADVDMERREIRIVVKKNRKVHELPLNEAALGVLNRQRRVCEYVFAHPLTGQKIKDVRGALEASAKRAGLGKVTWHMFRHTIATRLLENADVVTVKEVLGHQSINTTIRYTHPSRKRKQTAMEQLPGGRTVPANDNVATAKAANENRPRRGDNLVTMPPRTAVG